MAVCLPSLIFAGFPVRFHWPVSCQSNLSLDATERSIVVGYQLSPPENKTFIFQLWLYILKAFCCVFVPFTLEIVLPYLLGLGCYFGEVISI